MKKIITIAILFIGFSLQNVTAQEKITFDVTMPQQVDAGKSFTVELTINKHSISGDARFIQRLPDGFTAEEIPDKSAGAQFEWRATNQQIYFRWDSAHTLPDAPVLNIAYRVVTAPNCQTGEMQINGRFIYTDAQGEVAREEMISPVFNIVAEIVETPVVENAVETSSPITFQEPIVATPAPVATPIVSNIVVPKSKIEDEDIGAPIVRAPVENVEQPIVQEKVAPNVYVVRQTPYIEDNIYRINLLLTKGDLDGYGCIEEIISTPSTIEVTESKSAKVEITDNSIKFTWAKLPPENNIPLSYKITAVQFVDNITKADIIPYGKFYYANDYVTDTIDVVERDIAISQWLPVPDATPTDISLSALITGGGGSSNTSSSKNHSHCNVSRGRTGKGLVFKIQVLAARKSLSDNEVCEKLRQKNIETREVITEDVVRHEEFAYKYAIGNFRSYEQACILRDNMQRRFGKDNSGRPNAFLVCYYNGDRITVQEALLIEGKLRESERR